ncbi:MAG TPA: DNA polymerase I [Ktedonobacteraceae bacterium]|jgi:DNA polymerase-1|nr:DNA polymerase I [Ktedonobacteraceae bacterium]
MSTNTNKRKKLVLIDGHAIIHRAFHAVPDDLSTSTGEPVNATFGFTSMLMKALLEERPDYIAVTFDRPTPTFRHERYEQYKAHRPTLPDNIRPQFGRIREVVRAFGIQIYEKDGYEADDILGTLSVQATQQGVDTVIYTGDMDTLQLVNEHVRVKVAKRGITEVTEYDEAEIEARYGFPPDKLPDFKGLVGDKSDNIPGVPGIGEKTASRLLAEYGDLEGVLAHAGDLKPREQKLLQENAEQARESKFLATIVRDAPVQLDLEACRLTHVNGDTVVALFRQLEFRSQVERAFALFRQLGINVVTNETAPEKESEEAEPAAPATEEMAAEEETLRFAPPVGMVPIVTPPPPPDDTGRVNPLPWEPQAQGSAAVGKGAHSAVAEKASGESDVDAPATEEPTQLSLFETAEPHTGVVHRLHLPGPASMSAPLYLEDETNAGTNTMIIDSEEALRVLVRSLSSAGGFAFDTETTSEDPLHAELVGISCSMAAGEAYYIPVGHIEGVDGQEPGPQLPLPYVLEKLRPVLEDRTIRKYMHNAKYDMAVLERYGITLRGLGFDTMLGAYLIEPGRRGLGLKEQVFQRLGPVMTPISELIGSGSKMISMARVPVRKAADYAGADADMTLRLIAPIMAELRQNNLLDLYNRIELPLIPVLMQMEAYGVALDADFLRTFGEQLDEQLHRLEHAIYDSVGGIRFNINSTKQLGDILFTQLKLPAGRKTKTGYSVNADVIESLQGKHPIIDHLLAYRQLSKLKSTYVDGLLALMDTSTGRIHTSFNQTVASSGRLSSSNPNLQNIPVRTELGRQIRRAFIADPSYTLLTADYSQIELRILAHITGEARLVEAFSKDEDIHTITASSLFNVPVEQVTRDQRRLAKTVVYAVLYGQSAFGLSQVTGMSNADAASFIKRYHETFPLVKVYVDKTLHQARTQGYTNTYYGRKRFFPEMRSLSHNERQALEREAINMPIQGTNADLIKMAMIRIDHALRQQRMKTRMILQVHDELVFEVPVEELERARRLIKREMEGVEKLRVPIKVEMKVGRNWYAAEPMES